MGHSDASKRADAALAKRIKTVAGQSGAGDVALKKRLKTVEGESEAADAALETRLATVERQQAAFVHWLIVLSVAVVATGILAGAALIAVVILIAILA